MSGAPSAATGRGADPALAFPGRRRLADPIWTREEIEVVRSFATSRGPIPLSLNAPEAVGAFYANLGPVAARVAVNLIEDAIYGALVLEGADPEVAEALAAAFADKAWLAAQDVWLDGVGTDPEVEASH